MSRHVGVEPRYAGRIESRPRPYDPRRAPALERNRSNLEQNRTNSSIYLPLPPESNWRRLIVIQLFTVSFLLLWYLRLKYITKQFFIKRDFIQQKIKKTLHWLLSLTGVS